MDSAVFLALVVLSQIIATPCTLGEIDDLIRERRMGVYRKRVVTSLTKIVMKKIPRASGVERGRATDTYNCGKCFLSDKVTTDSKCIKSCTRIMRFSNNSPTDPKTKECDTCVATAVNRANRDCEDTCSVRHLATITADVVNEAISFQEKALLQTSSEHEGDNEPTEEEIEIEDEPAEMRFRTRKTDATDQNNDHTRDHSELERKSGKSSFLSMFRSISYDDGSEADIYKISDKIDEDFLNGGEYGKSGAVNAGFQPKSRSAVYKSGFDNSGRFVHPNGRSGSLSGSSHQLLNRSDDYNNFIKFKNFVKASNFFHPDNKYVSGNGFGADADGTDNLKTRTKNYDISNYDALEDLNNGRHTEQASRSGGGFNLRDILSESVIDLNAKQQARIARRLKKLGDDPQSSRAEEKYDAVNRPDYNQLASKVNDVKDHQKRIHKGFLSNHPADASGGVHSQRRNFNGRSGSSHDEEDSDYKDSNEKHYRIRKPKKWGKVDEDDVNATDD